MVDPKDKRIAELERQLAEANQGTRETLGLFLSERDENIRLERQLALVQSQRNAAIEAEKRDASKAFDALVTAGYPTPVETYGSNSSWAISDLCRALAEAKEDTADLEYKFAACKSVIRGLGGCTCDECVESEWCEAIGAARQGMK